MQKPKRLAAIEKIITGEDINSQDILLKKLKARGLNCTQATLSRNLRQLGAGRVPDGRGGYKYTLTRAPLTSFSTNGKLQVLPVIQDIVDAKGFLVMKTLPGNASNTAIYLDNAARYEIAGTIAGDDTILIIPKDGITSNQVHKCLELILPGLHEQIKHK